MPHTKPTEDQFRSIWTEAHNAGLHAASACNPQMIRAVSSTNPLDVSAPFPICGFAWINIKPGNSRFARFLTSSGIASRDSYYGGVSIRVHEFGQSYDLKRTYARHVSSHLSSALKDIDPRIRVSFMSRLD